jgi:hypothetical protein
MRLPRYLRLGLLLLAAAFSYAQPRPAQAAHTARLLLASQLPRVPIDAPRLGDHPNTDPRQYFVIDAILLLYYFAVYAILYTRRDSAPVVIQYAPPENLSPAQLRLLLTGDSDRKTVAAVVLSLAARGLVTIKCLDNFYLITKRVDLPPPGLPAEEDLAFRVMFDLAPQADRPIPLPFIQKAVPEGSYLLHPIAGEGFAALLRAIQKAMRSSYERRLFSRYLALSAPAAVLSIYFLCATNSIFPFSLILFLPVLAGVLFAIFTPHVRDALRNRTPLNRKGAMVVVIFMFICYVGIVAGLSHNYPNTFLFTLFLAIFVNVWFPSKLRTLSAEGRKLLHQLKGYRLFLETVEVDKIQRVIGDNWTPSQTTTNLAYSIAFDLHGGWEDYLAQSDFHSVYWAPSKTKPRLPGMPDLSAGNANFRRYLIQSGVIAILAVVANAIARSQLEFMFYLFVLAGIARFAQYIYEVNQAKQ